MSKVVIVILVCYGLLCLLGKLLFDIVGKLMIQYVYECVLQVVGVVEVWVVIDDLCVEQVVQVFGGKVIMMCNDYEFGIDWLVEVMYKVEVDIYINLQGDELMICLWDVEMLL